MSSVDSVYLPEQDLLIRLGSSMSCRHLVENHSAGISRVLLYNAAFWPTAIFTAGVIGLFFSCIYWGRHDSKWVPQFRDSFVLNVTAGTSQLL